MYHTNEPIADSDRILKTESVQIKRACSCTYYMSYNHNS